MPSAPSPSHAIDVYLSVQSKRAGKIKGESQATGHVDEIEVRGWSWGVAASAALGSSQATGRRSYKHLTVLKHIDAASTALMSMLAHNDEIKEAKLSLRKAGEGQRDYFVVTLTNARLMSLDIDCDDSGLATERIALSFTKVQVDHETQRSDGQRGGGTSFQDDILPV